MPFSKEELSAMKQSFSTLSMVEGRDGWAKTTEENKTFFVLTDDKKVLEDLASKGILSKQQLTAITAAMPLGKEGWVDQSPQVYIIQLDGKDASHLKGVRAFEATVHSDAIPGADAYAKVNVQRTLNIAGEAPDKAVPQESDISTKVLRKSWKLTPVTASAFLDDVKKEKFAAASPDTTAKYAHAPVTHESEFGHGLSGVPPKLSQTQTTDRSTPPRRG